MTESVTLLTLHAMHANFESPCKPNICLQKTKVINSQTGLTCNIDCKCFRVVLVNKIAGLEIRLPQYSIENPNETARNCNRLNTAWKVQ